MQVAVPGVENVADGEAVLAGDLADEAEGGFDFRARHNAVLDIIGRADAADGAEGVPAALPQQLALFGGASHSEFTRATQRAGLAELFGLFFDGFPQTLELNQQDGGGVAGIAGVRGLFNHAEHHAIEHLDGDRSDGAGGDLGDGAAGVGTRFENRQHGLDALGPVREANRDFRDQHHRAFRPGEEAGEVVAGQIELSAAGFHHRTVGEDQFEAKHMIGGDAVGQRVRAAGVLGHVASDGAGALAGRIGRIEIAGVLNGQGQVQVDHTRLDHGSLIAEIDLEDAVHARERHGDAAFSWDGTAGKPGAGAAAYQRHFELTPDFDDGRNLFGRTRENDEIGSMLVDAAVVFVDGEVFGAVEITARADEGSDALLAAGGQHAYSLSPLRYSRKGPPRSGRRRAYSTVAFKKPSLSPAS